MRILFVTSECAPFSKSGGLADVAFSLPPALKQAGNDVAILTPLYQCVWQRFQEEIQFVMDGDIPHGGADYRCNRIFRYIVYAYICISGVIILMTN